MILVIGQDMVTVVVPTFDEEEAVGMVLDEVRAAGYERVLVVEAVMGILMNHEGDFGKAA